MRRETDYFDGAELDLVYMAHRLPEALKLESLFTSAHIDYLVETGTYTSGFFIKRDLTGAFFYVAPADSERARELLRSRAYKPYLGE